jgi:hypothetical protein
VQRRQRIAVNRADSGRNRLPARRASRPPRDRGPRSHTTA